MIFSCILVTYIIMESISWIQKYVNFSPNILQDLNPFIASIKPVFH